eukprot:COSAG06_NODE_14647_length_1139_cov_1.092308_2_plen_75_part_00
MYPADGFLPALLGTPQQHRSSTEQVALVALLVWFLATAWVLGLGGAQPILEGQEWTEADVSRRLAGCWMISWRL